MTTIEITPAIISELGFSPRAIGFDARLIAQSQYWMQHGKLIDIDEMTPWELSSATEQLRASASIIEFDLAWYESGKKHHGGPTERHNYSGIPVQGSPLLTRMSERESETFLLPPDAEQFLAETHSAIEADRVKQMAMSWAALKRHQPGSYSLLENVHWNLNNRRYPECSEEVQGIARGLRVAIDMIEGRIGFDGKPGTRTMEDVLFHVKKHGRSFDKFDDPKLARTSIMKLWDEIPAFSVHAVDAGPIVRLITR